MTDERKIELLKMTTWSANEIQEFLECKSKGYAFKIKKRAILEGNCGLFFDKRKVHVDKFLTWLYGTSRKDELSILLIQKGENINDQLKF